MTKVNEHVTSTRRLPDLAEVSINMSTELVVKGHVDIVPVPTLIYRGDQTRLKCVRAGGRLILDEYWPAEAAEASLVTLALPGNYLLDNLQITNANGSTRLESLYTRRVTVANNVGGITVTGMIANSPVFSAASSRVSLTELSSKDVVCVDTDSGNVMVDGGLAKAWNIRSKTGAIDTFGVLGPVYGSTAGRIASLADRLPNWQVLL